MSFLDFLEFLCKTSSFWDVIFKGSVLVTLISFSRSFRFLTQINELTEEKVSRLIERIRFIEKDLDEKTAYLNDYIKDLNIMSTNRAQYASSQFDFLRSEIHDIHRHLQMDLTSLEYRKFDPEAGDGRSMESGKPL